MWLVDLTCSTPVKLRLWRMAVSIRTIWARRRLSTDWGWINPEVWRLSRSVLLSFSFHLLYSPDVHMWLSVPLLLWLCGWLWHSSSTPEFCLLIILQDIHPGSSLTPRQIIGLLKSPASLWGVVFFSHQTSPSCLSPTCLYVWKHGSFNVYFSVVPVNLLCFCSHNAVGPNEAKCREAEEAAVPRHDINEQLWSWRRVRWFRLDGAAVH